MKNKSIAKYFEYFSNNSLRLIISRLFSFLSPIYSWKIRILFSYLLRFSARLRQIFSLEIRVACRISGASSEIESCSLYAFSRTTTRGGGGGRHGYGKRKKKTIDGEKNEDEKAWEGIGVYRRSPRGCGDRCSIDEFIVGEWAIRLKLKIRREGKFISARDAFGNCSSPVLHLSPSLIIPPSPLPLLISLPFDEFSCLPFHLCPIHFQWTRFRLFVNSKKLFTFKVL